MQKSKSTSSKRTTNSMPLFRSSKHDTSCQASSLRQSFDSSRSETETLVDYVSDNKGKMQTIQKGSHLPMVAEMLDPEDMAWGSPSSSTSWAWPSFAKKSKSHEHRRTGGKSR
ncbi:hypothetical protein K435DRAFT_785828 [Dendrothele bispora CBS 962.96]|uniref:Uncharacterized protein n=1 Tax=Dendrothele bispora (strain CBS 962.96) TaxID=1314807 RepID=A0A4V4HBI1_DENBC|nr:hypothetical protein K435DRAFT_785828 [Dendrothele bispora CBS 962.96]